MAKHIDYYFTLLSPWAYMGHDRLVEMAQKYGYSIGYKPMPIMRVFDETGGLPLGKRPPARQKYRIMELQRWREKLGLPFHIHPQFWPLDIGLADKLVVAAAQHGKDAGDLAGRIFRGIFEQQRNLADEATLIEVLKEVGLEAALLDAAKAAPAQTQYDAYHHEAVAAGVFGSPAYVRGGEIFWGQDRLALLEDAMKSGRAPYRSDV